VFTDLGWMGLFDVRGNPVNRPTGDANVNHGLLSLPTN
jgi:hypothetical protein